MKQPTTVKEAKSMVKERWLDHRVEKLAKENDELREAVDELREDLDEAQGRSKETLAALSKTRRPGRMKWLVLAGGAYVLGAKAGRARYEQIKGWTRSMTRSNGNGTSMDATTDATTTATTTATPKPTGKPSGV
jgi:cell division septum initiation protein DivIVA